MPLITVQGRLGPAKVRDLAAELIVVGDSVAADAVTLQEMVDTTAPDGTYSWPDFDKARRSMIDHLGAVCTLIDGIPRRDGRSWPWQLELIKDVGLAAQGCKKNFFPETLRPFIKRSVAIAKKCADIGQELNSRLDKIAATSDERRSVFDGLATESLTIRGNLQKALGAVDLVRLSAGAKIPDSPTETRTLSDTVGRDVGEIAASIARLIETASNPDLVAPDDGAYGELVSRQIGRASCRERV